MELNTRLRPEQANEWSPDPDPDPDRNLNLALNRLLISEMSTACSELRGTRQFVKVICAQALIDVGQAQRGSILFGQTGTRTSPEGVTVSRLASSGESPSGVGQRRCGHASASSTSPGVRTGQHTPRL